MGMIMPQLRIFDDSCISRPSRASPERRRECPLNLSELKACSVSGIHQPPYLTKSSEYIVTTPYSSPLALWWKHMSQCSFSLRSPPQSKIDEPQQFQSVVPSFVQMVQP